MLINFHYVLDNGKQRYAGRTISFFTPGVYPAFAIHANHISELFNLFASM